MPQQYKLRTDELRLPFLSENFSFRCCCLVLIEKQFSYYKNVSCFNFTMFFFMGSRLSDISKRRLSMKMCQVKKC